jgi:hypothetical protein
VVSRHDADVVGGDLQYVTQRYHESFGAKVLFVLSRERDVAG